MFFMQILALKISQSGVPGPKQTFCASIPYTKILNYGPGASLNSMREACVLEVTLWRRAREGYQRKSFWKDCIYD
jgi:hypothetical protein